MGAEIFHADGRTDMKLIYAYRNFANAPKHGAPGVDGIPAKMWRETMGLKYVEYVQWNKIGLSNIACGPRGKYVRPSVT